MALDIGCVEKNFLIFWVLLKDDHSDLSIPLLC